jgi:hypothetical protein
MAAWNLKQEVPVGHFGTLLSLQTEKYEVMKSLMNTSTILSEAS